MRQSEPEEQLSLPRVRGSDTSIAVISRRGGAIHQLLVDEIEIVPKFAHSNPVDFVYGNVLAPWPNRLEDGEYEFLDQRYHFSELDAQGNKNHGLVLNEIFEVRDHSDQQLVLGYRFGSDAGYPFEIDLEISYLLVADGLEVSATAQNLGKSAPFAIGFHPYILTGPKFTLSAEFSQRSIHNQRLLPVGMEEISGLNLNQDSLELPTLDHCFSGASEVVIRREDGEILVQALDELPYFMLYRPDRLLSNAGEVLAVEPQSTMANVFREDPESCLLASGAKRSYRFAIRKR